MNKISKLLETVKATVQIDVALFAQLENGSLAGEIPPPPSDANGYCRANGYTYISVELSGQTVWLGFKSREEDETIAKLLATAVESAGCENYASLDEEERVRLLLEGGLTEERIKEAKDAFTELSQSFYALALCTEEKQKLTDLRRYLEAFSDADEKIVAMSDRVLMYFRKKSREYADSADFAAVLYENIKEEMRIDLAVAVVGEVTDFQSFASSYKIAMRTLRWGKKLQAKVNVFRYEDCVLAELLSTLDKSKIGAVLDTLKRANKEELWADEELVNTAEEFLRCSLNVSETGRKLYIHRNTLMYRLDKIQSETGLNLHNFEDAELFRLVSLLRKLVSLR